METTLFRRHTVKVSAYIIIPSIQLLGTREREKTVEFD